MLVRLSSKGQLVIPKAIRKDMGLQTGTQFHVHLEGRKIILEPILSHHIEALYGKYEGADLLTELEADHLQELENEKSLRT